MKFLAICLFLFLIWGCSSQKRFTAPPFGGSVKPVQSVIIPVEEVSLVRISVPPVPVIASVSPLPVDSPPVDSVVIPVVPAPPFLDSTTSPPKKVRKKLSLIRKIITILGLSVIALITGILPSLILIGIYLVASPSLKEKFKVLLASDVFYALVIVALILFGGLIILFAVGGGVALV